MAKKVPSGLVTACRLAGWPTRRSSEFEKATTEGVVRAPSAFSITRGVEPSMTATHELVVPRSIPITLAIVFIPFFSEIALPRSGTSQRSNRVKINALKRVWTDLQNPVERPQGPSGSPAIYEGVVSATRSVKGRKARKLQKNAKSRVFLNRSDGD